MFPSLPLVRTLCAVGTCTQALVPYLRVLCYCFGACTKVGSFLFSLCWRCVAVCGGFFANLAKQRRKNCGGVSAVGKTDFSILIVVFCVVFLFFLLFHWRARDRVSQSHNTFEFCMFLILALNRHNVLPILHGNNVIRPS